MAKLTRVALVLGFGLILSILILYLPVFLGGAVARVDSSMVLTQSWRSIARLLVPAVVFSVWPRQVWWCISVSGLMGLFGESFLLIPTLNLAREVQADVPAAYIISTLAKATLLSVCSMVLAQVVWHRWLEPQTAMAKKN